MRGNLAMGTGARDGWLMRTSLPSPAQMEQGRSERAPASFALRRLRRRLAQVDLVAQAPVRTAGPVSQVNAQQAEVATNLVGQREVLRLTQLGAQVDDQLHQPGHQL